MKLPSFLLAAGCLLACNLLHAQDETFEAPRSLPAAQIVPKLLLQTPQWTVAPEVPTYGFYCHYGIQSIYGHFEADCDVEFYDTLRELRAIGVMEQLSRTKIFTDAAKKAAAKPLQAVGQLIEHPVDTVSGIPKGALRLVQNTAARVNEQFKGAPKSKYQDPAALDLVGFSAVKRAMAAKLGVDPYSDNQVLQSHLNKLAWAAYAGKMGIQAATSLIPVSAVTYSIMGLNLSADLTNRIVDNSPTDLRILDRKDLQNMGIPASSVNKFLNATIYSPTRSTILVDAIKKLRGVRGLPAYLEAAGQAGDEVQAIFYERIAQMYAIYHRNVSPLKQIVFLFDMPAAITMDGRLVVMLEFDYIWWTPAVQQVATAFKNYPLPGRNPTPCELWISGQFSPMAANRLAGMGFALHPKALERLSGGGPVMR